MDKIPFKPLAPWILEPWIFNPVNLLSLTYDQLSVLFQQRYDRGGFHASALYRSFFQRPDLKISDLPAFAANLPLARRIQGNLGHRLPRISDTQDQDGVTKLALKLDDGLSIETVIIPMPHHATVCISSQVGCRMGCRFCQTGQLGLQRHLRAEEIVAQVYLAKVVMGFAIRNVVFMGMGEPLDNWDNVIQAIRVLSDQRGLDIAQRHITLSTIGLIPGLQRLADLNWPHLGVALSLNAPDDGLRQDLMPATRSYALTDLKHTLQSYPLAKGRVLFVTYVLIKDINDSEDHARQTAAFLKGLPVKVNLIPYNPGDQSLFQTPKAQQVEKFRQVLVDEHLFVRLRCARGDGIQAACGQLGGCSSQSIKPLLNSPLLFSSG